VEEEEEEAGEEEDLENDPGCEPEDDGDGDEDVPSSEEEEEEVEVVEEEEVKKDDGSSPEEEDVPVVSGGGEKVGSLGLSLAEDVPGRSSTEDVGGGVSSSSSPPPLELVLLGSASDALVSTGGVDVGSIGSSLVGTEVLPAVALLLSPADEVAEVSGGVSVEPAVDPPVSLDVAVSSSSLLPLLVLEVPLSSRRARRRMAVARAGLVRWMASTASRSEGKTPSWNLPGRNLWRSSCREAGEAAFSFEENQFGSVLSTLSGTAAAVGVAVGAAAWASTEESLGWWQRIMGEARDTLQSSSVPTSKTRAVLRRKVMTAHGRRCLSGVELTVASASLLDMGSGV
jgi:hypothetical protein